MDDPRSTAGKASTILAVVELAVADTPVLAQQHDLLEFVHARLEARMRGIRSQIAAEVRRRPTPPPRRTSQIMPNATAPTARHDTAALAAALEDQREIGDRPTPEAFEPPALTNNHPGRER